MAGRKKRFSTIQGSSSRLASAGARVHVGCANPTTRPQLTSCEYKSGRHHDTLDRDRVKKHGPVFNKRSLADYSTLPELIRSTYFVFQPEISTYPDKAHTYGVFPEENSFPIVYPLSLSSSSSSVPPEESLVFMPATELEGHSMFRQRRQASESQLSDDNTREAASRPGAQGFACGSVRPSSRAL